MPSFPPIPQFDLTAQQPVTIDSLVAALTARLGVPSNPYWVLPELTAYVIEALRTWNAFTKHWTVRRTLETVPGTLFYDLSEPQGPSNQPLIPYTVRDIDVVPTMEYHLLEPANTAVWTGTEMFTLADLTDSLQRRRDQFLLETGAVLSQYTLAVNASSAGRFTVPDALIDVRRAVFQDTDGKYYQMSREDEIALASFLPLWDRTSKTPKAWSVSVTPPFQIQIAPAPKVLGYLQMLVVATGAMLSLSSAVPLGVPDDFSWVVKFGALADLLGKDSPARDTARATYCEQRYQDGADLARRASSVINCTIGNRQCRVGSLYDMDAFTPNWHNRIGTPNRMGMAGMNILSPGCVPDTQYGIAVDIVQNAPVASSSADLGLSPSVADALIDYAEHLAAFKMGGEEFTATMPQYQNFMRLAGVNNDRYTANAQFATTLRDRETREETERWRRVPLQPAS